METKTKETTLSSFRQCNENLQQNLSILSISISELAALASLTKNKEITNQKSGKVILFLLLKI